jgi:hypothetical protein
MTIAGAIRNGVVVLENPPPLADGTRVEVILPGVELVEPDEGLPTLRNLLKLAGSANDLPPDMVEQHDHYIHGTPRR